MYALLAAGYIQSMQTITTRGWPQDIFHWHADCRVWHQQTVPELQKHHNDAKWFSSLFERQALNIHTNMLIYTITTPQIHRNLREWWQKRLLIEILMVTHTGTELLYFPIATLQRVVDPWQDIVSTQIVGSGTGTVYVYSTHHSQMPETNALQTDLKLLLCLSVWRVHVLVCHHILKVAVKTATILQWYSLILKWNKQWQMTDNTRLWVLP